MRLFSYQRFDVNYYGGDAVFTTISDHALLKGATSIHN